MSQDNDALMLDSAGPTETGFGMKMHAGGPKTQETLLFIADSIRSTLDEHNAPNYVEMEVRAGDGKQYIMTLQRGGKITPHQARVAAEESLAAMFSDEAIERAAKALNAEHAPAWEILPDWVKDDWRKQVRVVVAALKGDA